MFRIPPLFIVFDQAHSGGRFEFRATAKAGAKNSSARVATVQFEITTLRAELYRSSRIAFWIPHDGRHEEQCVI